MSIRPAKSDRAERTSRAQNHLRAPVKHRRASFSAVLERKAKADTKGRHSALRDPGKMHRASDRNALDREARTQHREGDAMSTEGAHIGPNSANLRHVGARGDERMRQAGEAEQDMRRDDGVADRAEGQREEASLAAFQPPPSVIWAPASPHIAPAEAPAAGSAQAHAETVAMADRLLQSLHVGRSGSGGHEVRLRLAPTSRYAGLEVRLEDDGGTLRARVVAEAGCEDRAIELAEEIAREFNARGIDVADVELERA